MPLKTIKKALALAAIATLLALSACSGISLRSETLDKTSTHGDQKSATDANAPSRIMPQVQEDVLFTLIYFVGQRSRDLRRAVILDIESDEIEFIPRVSSFDYEILQSVTLPEAVYEAEIFLSHEIGITNYYFKKIIGPDGSSTIGFEIRPIYQKNLFGDKDPLEIRYSYNRQQVDVSIRFKPSLNH